MSKYTSFVPVDERVRVDPDGERVVVHQPVELAEGVSLEGIAAAQLTRTAIPTGDPVLSIDAPDAQRVVAHFPFGMTKALRKDAEGRWFVRFLVPKGFSDATNYVRVVITEADGRRRTEEIPYQLDGDAPELDVEVLTGIRGYGAVVRVKGSEALSEVKVTTPWGTTVLTAEDQDDPCTFTGHVLIPDDAALGEAPLEVVALDEAGNTGRGRA